METTVRKLKEEMQCMLTGNILPFWMNHMVDSEYGGFYGRISGTGERVPGASKGVVLNARILWTFSSAYRLLHKDEYLKAQKEFEELLTAIIARISLFDESIVGIQAKDSFGY